jgi:hypothetical protein
MRWYQRDPQFFTIVRKLQAYKPAFEAVKARLVLSLPDDF